MILWMDTIHFAPVGMDEPPPGVDSVQSCIPVLLVSSSVDVAAFVFEGLFKGRHDFWFGSNPFETSSMWPWVKT